MSEVTAMKLLKAEVEELDKEISKVDESEFVREMPEGVVGAAAISPEQLGSLYKSIRPILVLASKLWFFPAKWQSLLARFLKYMDAVTGTTDGSLV